MKRKASSRALEGVIVSDKMHKTVVVKVARTLKHSVLGKILRRTKNYKVHDENGEAKVGDLVEFSECRPLSKSKHMILGKVLRKSQTREKLV